jgi:hypothetical protein
MNSFFNFFDFQKKIVEISLVNKWLMVVVFSAPLMMTPFMGITIAPFLESIALDLFY